MLKIKDLQKTYNHFSLQCSMEVQPGRITGLIGQNGAGKSTTFKAVLGLIPYEQGEITLLGQPLASFSAADKAQLGVVLSDAGFSGYFTVSDLIPILQTTYLDFDKPYFLQQLRRFDLPLDKQIKTFSTGMRAKLKVVIAVSHRAKFLILDEPTAGLDIVARDDLLSLLREYMEQDERRAILISSHISSDLETLCDDIYMIHDGKIILHEDTDVLLGSYALLKMDRAQYDALDKRYLLYTVREPYGVFCLTAHKQFYLENYPGMLIENGSIDSIITTIVKGENV